MPTNPDAASPPSPRLIVGVGASAGGLEAFTRLLAALPARTGMAFLFVQHLDPTRPSLLTELLGPKTSMAVVSAEQGAAVEADTVYVIPPDTALAIDAGRVALSAPTLVRGVRLPIDHLFRSLARELGPRAAGIVLSGAGSDGSAGLRAIKAAGGLAIVQTPVSSSQSGMPQSAVDTGVVDLVIEIERMPVALERFARLPPASQLEPPPGADDAASRPGVLGDRELERLRAVLEAQERFDLGVYKRGTVERRVLRRMALGGFQTPAAYVERLQRDERERHALVQDLLISVTEFFRDSDACDALRREAIDPLVASLQAGDTLRAWVPGCATGEEAYSIAIECLEAIEAGGRPIGLQVFATDIDEEAIAVGRAGVYSYGIAERITPERLQRYFAAAGDRGYQVARPLRDAVSFAEHDLTRDPPFSRMDLISCRNLLIYLRPEVQQRVLTMLHFALNPDRYLFLGTSESTGAVRDLFSVVSKPCRIYRKVGASRSLDLGRNRRDRPGRDTPRTGPGAQTGPRTDRPVTTRPDRDDPVRRQVMQALVPPCLVVAGSGAVLFMHGDLRPFLRFPEGEDLRFDVSALVTPELATRTRAALYRCRRDREPVVAESALEADGTRRVRIAATPAPGLGDQAVILSFELAGTAGAEPAPAASPGDRALIVQLERELDATRGDLRHTVEELETSTEELRSSNEEAMSMNEELQSSNEELEATTEELRSLNEELTTVNSQLREKVEQLEQAHDDLTNFFASTKIATLFLDDALRVKRITPAAAELLRIGDPDLGRPVGDIARDLLQHGLVEDARAVLKHLVPRSRDLRTGQGRWMARTVLPYRTEHRSIEGVVVTLVDITDLKNTTERLAWRERQQAVIARLGLQALKEPDLQSFMDQTVREVCRTLEAGFAKILELQPGRRKLFLRAGVGWEAGLVGSANVPATDASQAGYTLRAGEPVLVEDLPTETRFTGLALLTDHGVRSGVSCVIRYGESEYGVIGVHDRRPAVFTPEDVNFLQAVASVIGSAIWRHQTRTRLAIERGVTRVLADSRSLEDAAAGVLGVLSRELRTTVGELWWADESRTRLTCRLVTTVPARDREAVEERLSWSAFGPGQGLVGQVFARARALWITDFRDPSEFARLDEISSLGLVTGVAFPVVAGGEVLGVVTAFSKERVIAAEILLRSLEALGRSIGEFTRRLDIEARAERLAAITASSHDAILSYDFDGIITEWLGGAEALYGYPAAEMIGASVDRLVPEDRREELRAVIALVRKGEILEPLETERVCRDGSHVEVSVRTSPIRNRRGDVIGVSSTDRDDTRHKAAERRLVDADRQKDEFLAMLGHELRNPLAAVRSAAEVLKVHARNAPPLERTQAILERQTGHMAKLLDGLLDVSRIIRGKIAIESDAVDLAEVCRDVAADVTERIGSRALSIRSDLPTGPVWVIGDRVRLTQVVDNLLSNAVKYTPDDGSVTLTLAPVDGAAVITVRDTGVGIEPELLPDIFDVFRQARQTLDRSSGGLGLGLALVKSLVRMHGGDVEARSRGRGHGAEFIVRLPLTDRQRQAPDQPETVEATPLRLLVVEDNEDVAEMLQAVLRRAGHEVTVAMRGEEGVAMARASRPDAVLCDLGLPGGMTGFDVARTLRGNLDTQGIALIALSGYSRPEDKARAAEAGFDGHIAKPVDARSIGRALAELVRPAPAGAGDDND